MFLTVWESLFRDRTGSTMSNYRLRSFCLVLAITLSLPLSATAQEGENSAPKSEASPEAALPTPVEPTPAPTSKQQASALYKKANQQVKQGLRMSSEGKELLKLALDNYNSAKELFSSFKIDLNIGGLLAAMGRRPPSALYHEIFLAKMPKTVPPHIVAMAKAKLTVLRGELASVRLETSQDGVQIQINGDDVATTPQAYP